MSTRPYLLQVLLKLNSKFIRLLDIYYTWKKSQKIKDMLGGRDDDNDTDNKGSLQKKDKKI